MPWDTLDTISSFQNLLQDVIRVGSTVYDCNDGLNNAGYPATCMVFPAVAFVGALGTLVCSLCLQVHLYWDVEKQAHCCAELGMGCPENALPGRRGRLLN